MIDYHYYHVDIMDWMRRNLLQLAGILFTERMLFDRVMKSVSGSGQTDKAHAYWTGSCEEVIEVRYNN